MKWPAYVAYQGVSEPWLRSLPEGWATTKAGRLFSRIFNGLTVDQVGPDSDTVPVTRIETISTGEFDFEKTGFIPRSQAPLAFRLKPGDIQFSHINSIKMIGNCAQLEVDREIYGGMNLLTLRPRQGVDARFVYWLMKSEGFRDEARQRAKPAINQASLPQSSLTSIRVPLPTPSEQRAIGVFLDRETAKIDNLIGKQEQLIATLGEDRTATITHAVTKGLDPGRENDDTGVEWLGAIPSHWSVVELRYLGEPIIGLTYSPDEVVDPEADSALVLRSSNIQGGKLDLVDCVYVSAGIPPKLRLRIGDVLLCSRNGSRALIGKNIRIGQEVDGQTFGAFMTVFRSDHNEFLYWVFNSQLFEYQTATFLSSTINQLTTSNLKSMAVPFPPSTEQVEIAAYLDEVTSKFDQLIAKANEMIQTLREYRSALITDAVTGKIDVRGAS